MTGESSSQRDKRPVLIGTLDEDLIKGIGRKRLIKLLKSRIRHGERAARAALGKERKP